MSQGWEVSVGAVGFSWRVSMGSFLSRHCLLHPTSIILLGVAWELSQPTGGACNHPKNSWDRARPEHHFPGVWPPSAFPPLPPRSCHPRGFPISSPQVLTPVQNPSLAGSILNPGLQCIGVSSCLLSAGPAAGLHALCLPLVFSFLLLSLPSQTLKKTSLGAVMLLKLIWGHSQLVFKFIAPIPLRMFAI